MNELKVEHGVIINLPAEAIFAYMSDFANLVEWSSIVIAVRKTSQGNVYVGSTWRITIRFLGRWLESTYEVVEWEPHRLITLKSTSGIVPCSFSYTLEPHEAGGTSVSQEAAINIRLKGGFIELAESVLAGAARRQVEYDLLTLKDLLEASISMGSTIG